LSGFAETHFGRITDRGQAIAAMRGAAQGAALVAAIYALDPMRFIHAIAGEAFVLKVNLVLDAALLLFVAFSALRHRSRAFAVVMAGWVVLNTIGTILLRMEHMSFGNNIFLAAVGLYFAFRMVLATQRYHRFAGTRVHGGVAVLKNWAGCATLVLAVLGLHAVLARLPGVTVEPLILGSLILLVATLAYAVPFARWFPVLGKRPLTRAES